MKKIAGHIMPKPRYLSQVLGKVMRKKGIPEDASYRIGAETCGCVLIVFEWEEN